MSAWIEIKWNWLLEKTQLRSTCLEADNLNYIILTRTRRRHPFPILNLTLRVIPFFNSGRERVQRETKTNYIYRLANFTYNHSTLLNFNLGNWILFLFEYFKMEMCPFLLEHILSLLIGRWDISIKIKKRTDIIYLYLLVFKLTFPWLNGLLRLYFSFKSSS